MTPFQHILVPVDFGDATEPAIEVATDLARALDAQITLFHSVDVTPLLTTSALVPPVDIDSIVVSLQEEMKGLVEKTRQRWPRVDGFVKQGQVYDTVFQIAKTRGCDLIVIGTHGRRGVAHLLLGSVAEKVVRLSTVPVMTVHPRVGVSKESSAA
jgi:nucleotide-binding universal stress UspA family protein